MKNLFSPYIERNGVVIVDGALATELESRGADINDPLWSARLLIENPALIQQVHYDYLGSRSGCHHQRQLPGQF